MRAKISMEEIISIYLNNGIAKSLEGNVNSFDSSEMLLQLGYEQFGKKIEHSIFEKYYPVGANKGFTFKVYFYKNVPWTSAISFFRFKLDFVLVAAGSNLKNIEVFFDGSGFESGALVINNVCVCRFEFIKNKYPRALTLETIITENISIIGGKTKIETISNQLVKIKPDAMLGAHENVRKIFEIVNKSLAS